MTVKGEEHEQELASKSIRGRGNGAQVTEEGRFII